MCVTGLRLNMVSHTQYQLRQLESHNQILGVEIYRTRVLYVPQRPSMLPGTPRDFLQMLQGFTVYKKRMKESGSNMVSDRARVMDVAEQWGFSEELWDRSWSNLSGGESQRIALAIAVGLNGAEVLLLDGARCPSIGLNII